MRPRQLLLVPIVLAVIGLIFAFTIPGTFQCQGEAACFSGTVTRIVGGDTLVVDGQQVRLALASTTDPPDVLGSSGAASFLEEVCPVGSVVLVDEDDGHPEWGHGILLGVVYCNGSNLNKALLESGNGLLTKEFCQTSEFAASEWAADHGC